MKNIGVSAAALSLLALSGRTEDTGAPENGKTASDALPAFVRSSLRNDLALEALLRGQLVVDGNGCLRVGEAGPFVIWHHDSRIERTDDSRIKITDGFSGNTAYVGDEIAMGGGQGNRVPPATGGKVEVPSNVTKPIPAACASGEIWMAGRLMTEPERQRLPKR